LLKYFLLIDFLAHGSRAPLFLINKHNLGEIYLHKLNSAESRISQVVALRENVIKRTSGGSNLSFTLIDFRVPVDTK
jgi:hypothetical protein